MVSPTVKLNSGHDMPLVGFGLWKVDNATAADTVYNAIKVGYRLFDGACGESILVTAVSRGQGTGSSIRAPRMQSNCPYEEQGH